MNRQQTKRNLQVAIRRAECERLATAFEKVTATSPWVAICHAIDARPSLLCSQYF